MPHIQVLPRVPTFLEQLTPYISEFFGQVAGGVRQHYLEKNDRKILEEIVNPELSPMERIALYLKLSKPRQEAVVEGLRAWSQGEEFGYRKDREKRIKNAGIMDAYDKRLSQINADLKDPEMKRDERRNLHKLKEDLTKEQAVNRTLLRGGKQPKFKHLEMQPDEEASAEAPTQDQAQNAPMDNAQAPAQQQMTQAPQQKQKWDPNNPQHIFIRDAILKQFGGDKNRANQALAQEFEP